MGWLKHITNHLINIPIDEDDYSFNVHMKRNLILKSTCLVEIVKKDKIKHWLNYLNNIPVYKFYKITVNDAF
jgi:hypothetical protein